MIRSGVGQEQGEVSKQQQSEEESVAATETYTWTTGSVGAAVSMLRLNKTAAERRQVEGQSTHDGWNVHVVSGTATATATASVGPQ